MTTKEHRGGREWIGRQVEICSGTSTWESGQIVDYKPLRDEYKVRYEDNEENWKEINSMFRFKDEKTEKEKEEVLRQQEREILHIKNKLLETEDINNWLPLFIQKMYIFLGKDPTLVIDFLDTNKKVVDQLPQFIRTQPFPLSQKLSNLRKLVKDKELFHQISTILEDDKTYPIVTRRSGHGRKKEIEDFVKKQAQFMEIEETKSGETRGLNNKFQQNRMEERPKNGKKDEVSDIKKIVDLKKVMEGKKGEASKMVQGGPVEPKKTQIDQKKGN